MIAESIIILVSIIGAVSTFYVKVKYKWSPVKASALLSLIVGVVFFALQYLLQHDVIKTIPAVFIGASFAGMSAKRTVPNNWWVAFAGVVFGFIFLNTSKFFTGYGGGLGTTACLSVVITLGLMDLAKKLQKA